MAVSFTAKDREIIIGKLKEEARNLASIVGIKKTAVDRLVEAAGISKGMFYKIYPLKEMLFLEMIEDMHHEAYALADRIIKKELSDSSPDRALAEGLIAACEIMSESKMVEIIERDLGYLFSKIPSDIWDEFYDSDDIHIRRLFEENQLKTTCRIDEACDAVKGIFLTVNHRFEVGNNYNTVLRLIAEGTCRRLFE